MKNRLKLLIGTLALLVTTFFAATSAFGCWIFVSYQKECPKSLIQED